MRLRPADRAGRILSHAASAFQPVVKHLLLPLLVLGPLSLCGQPVDGPVGYAGLRSHLKAIGTATDDAARDSASAQVKRGLGAILGSDSAFTAGFSGVPISHVEAPDGTFRLFTWNVPHADGTFRYEGFLLVARRNRHELYELRDMTGNITRPAAVQLSPENWYGAVYYEVIPVKRGARTYYTLLGWKGHSGVETRKVIEVLALGGPVPKFGAPLFPGERQRKQREVYAFAAQGSMLLRWEPARKAIVMDHLSPTTPEFAGQPAFMAPDLSYDSYTWDKDHWRLDRDIDIRGTGKDKPYKAPPKEAR